MRLVIIWGLLISAICFEIFSIYVSGCIAELLLYRKGSKILSFIIGCLGYAISIIVIVLIFYVVTVHLDSLLEPFLLVAYILMLFLRLGASILLMGIYKLVAKMYNKTLLAIKENRAKSAVRNL